MANENELAKAESYTYGKANFIVVNADVQCDDATDQTTKLKNDDPDGVDAGYGKQMFDTNTDKKYFKEEKFPQICKHTGSECDIDLYSPWFNAAEVTYSKTDMAPLNEYYNAISELRQEMQKIETEIQKDNEDIINWFWLRGKEKKRRKEVREIPSSQEINDRLSGSVESGKEDISAYADILTQYQDADLGEKTYDFSSAEEKLNAAGEKLKPVEEMLKEKNEDKHPLKKESEAVCWKGGLITITTYGQELTEDQANDKIQTLITEYKKEETTEERKKQILNELKQLDPPPVLKKDADGSRYYGVSESVWQLKIVGWNEDVLNSDVINYTLKTCDILTPQQQRIFFAQCAAETEFGNDREEGSSRGPSWWGAGSIQLTHKDNYEYFQAYMEEKYPDYDFSQITSSGTTAPVYVGENYFWMAGGFWWDYNDVNSRLAGTYTSIYGGREEGIPDDPQDNLGISIAIQQGQNRNPATWDKAPNHWWVREDNHVALNGVFVVDDGTSDQDPDTPHNQQILDDLKRYRTTGETPPYR